jgi:DNA polymerase-1
MRILTGTLAGEPYVVNMLETKPDLDPFLEWVDRPHRIVALDTETTGLATFSPTFAVRLVQFGDEKEAWVLPALKFQPYITQALRRIPRMVCHNSPFDLLALDRLGYCRLSELQSRVADTSLLSHLLDPRGPEDGGTGQGLKNLAAHWVDPSAPDTGLGLHTTFRELGFTVANGFAQISFDNELYIRYAGLDVLLTARLHAILESEIESRGLSRLATFEHELAAVVTRMVRRGVKVDVGYTETLAADLAAEQAAYATVAAGWGVESVNSTRQVAEALAGMGEELTERTATGQPKVDRSVLLALADLDSAWQRIGAREPNELADAVTKSKRAKKWRSTYAEALLADRDSVDHVHPTIRTLAARTGRMSISGPPLQQLPSGDWRIRRSLIADDGYAIVAADYAQVELRVLAALANEKAMIAAIHDGEDLHSTTARLVYGDGFTKAQRKLAKGVGFGRVYGGGAATITRQTGADLAAVKAAIEGYDRAYPGIKRYSRRLQDRAEYGSRAVVTPTGRQLPLDRDRTYAALNYMIQSTSRDIFADALIRVSEAGFDDYLLLPVHDELVCQAPAGEADVFARDLAATMGTVLGEVPITAEGSVYGKSWGHGYGAPE